jgi:hypothetical protein
MQQPKRLWKGVLFALQLPTEVRLNILRHLVVFLEPLHDFVLDKQHRPLRSKDYDSALAILSTCPFRDHVLRMIVQT